MKRSITRLIDTLVPDDIKDFEQTEELARARALVFLLLAHLALCFLSLAAALFMQMPPDISNGITRAGMVGCMLLYSIALFCFKRTALYSLSGNIYAFAFYSTVVLSMFALPRADAYLYLLLLLALPGLVTLVANYSSGLIWLAITAATPLILRVAFDANISPFYIGLWTTTCAGVLLGIYLGHDYRESMAQRLNAERTQFEFDAAHDSLTGLANRATFDRRLRESIELCTSHGGKSVLTFIDLNQFKCINDTYGHQTGDIVLIAVANRLRALARRFDTVARLGGDEFAILFDQCSLEGAKRIIERIKTEIREPIPAQNQQLVIDCSIGIVVCPDDGLHPEQLAQIADARMYEAKSKAHTDLITRLPTHGANTQPQL